MICILCGTNHNVITAPFVDNPNKWTIHRADFVEITFEIGEGRIKTSTMPLTTIEKNYIIKHIIEENDKNL